MMLDHETREHEIREARRRVKMMKPCLRNVLRVQKCRTRVLCYGQRNDVMLLMFLKRPEGRELDFRLLSIKIPAMIGVVSEADML